jgi:hypothetical protein
MYEGAVETYEVKSREEERGRVGEEGFRSEGCAGFDGDEFQWTIITTYAFHICDFETLRNVRWSNQVIQRISEGSHLLGGFTPTSDLP